MQSPKKSATIEGATQRVCALHLTEERRADLAQYLARIDDTPASHTVKGMYVSGLIATMKAASVGYPEERVHAFKDYPMRDFMGLVLEAGATLYPQKRLGDALHALGCQAIPTFAESISGGVIMATAGRSWKMALTLISRGYEISLKPGKATVAVMEADRAVVQLRNVRNFGESYHVGVMTGLMHWCRLQGNVVPKVLSQSDTDLLISWS
ncbi:MAG: DUF2378 family protein [Myxococcales bacterium]|nr:DUF2378 family protein [Myxococcales bacterium]